MVRVTLRNDLEKRGMKLPQTQASEELAGLNRRQRTLLAYLREHDAINRIEYEQMFDVNSLTAKQDLGALVARGLIKRVGRARAVHYRGVE
jgi:predicted HTH transcriptional regulator